MTTTKSWNDYTKGVEVKAATGDEVTVIYNGLLAKSGADSVYIHYGYGTPTQWQNVCTTKMNKSGTNFETKIKVQNNATNICFKDSASNWDNNAGWNWIIH